MKFTPRPLAPDAADASRGHDRHPLRELALLITGLAGILAVAYLTAVLLAEVVVRGLAPATEARLFAAVSQAMNTPPALSPELEARRQMAADLLTRLLPHAALQGLPVTLVVWDREETNAFALPGGTLAVTPGLLRCLTNEAGMAFVLGHELGHFHRRDQLRGVSRQVGVRVLTSVALGGASELRVSADQLGGLALLAYSRDCEVAADRFAVKLMRQTLGSEAGAGQLFAALSGPELPGWAYMFATHPATSERIAALQAYAEELRRAEAGK